MPAVGSLCYWVFALLPTDRKAYPLADIPTVFYDQYIDRKANFKKLRFGVTISLVIVSPDFGRSYKWLWKAKLCVLDGAVCGTRIRAT
jgi:hypothetical protein